MLFHVTMTHTPDNCPGLNKEQMPAALASLEKLGGLAQELNIKVHFLLWGAPEHSAFALIEADNPGKLARYVLAMGLKQEVKVTPVQHMEEVIAMGKEMMRQSQASQPQGSPSEGSPSQGAPSEGSPSQGSPYGGSPGTGTPPPGQSSFPQS